MTALTVLQTCLRLTLAAALVRAASRIVVADAPFSFGAVVLAALMVVVAIWLACGIRTRIVALCAAALYAGYTVMLSAEEAGRHGSVTGLWLVLAIAMPLVAMGAARIGRVRAEGSDPA